MKYAACILLLYPLFGLSLAQGDARSNQKTRLLQQNRYQNIAGSPYYFPVWVLGNILRTDGETLENQWVNYNGYSHELEMRAEDGVYALDKLWYLRLEVFQDHNAATTELFPAPSLIFQFSADRNLADRYATILFTGTHFTLIKDFDVRKDDEGPDGPGKSINRVHFRNNSAYYLKKSGVLIPLVLQKRRIATAFGDDARIASYVASQKPDLHSEHDLVALVMYADTLD